MSRVSPRVSFFDSGSEDEAAQELVRLLKDLDIGSPLVLASRHGERLSAALSGEVVIPPAGADQHWASELGSRAHRSGAGVLVAIGGGRTLDVAKLSAARAGLPVVAVPTQLSHDGICSPVAVVPNEEGRSESLGAITPRAVFVSIPTLLGAPAASVAAGLGDLLANPLALRDWALAVEHDLEETNGEGWDLSVRSFEAAGPLLDADPQETAASAGALRTLADALVLSGLAMIVAGNSRPASGGEHEISHALDERFGGRALHGAQVAFGTIISTALYGDDPGPLKERLRRLGLPNHPSDLGLSEDELVEVLLLAPDTRPGRFTILEHADLDETSARRLVGRIWPD